MKSCFINYVRLGDSILQVFIMASLIYTAVVRWLLRQYHMVHWSTNYTVLLPDTNHWLICNQGNQWAVTFSFTVGLFVVCLIQGIWWPKNMQFKLFWNVNILCFCCNCLLREYLTFQDLSLHFNWWQIAMQWLKSFKCCWQPSICNSWSKILLTICCHHMHIHCSQPLVANN